MSTPQKRKALREAAEVLAGSARAYGALPAPARAALRAQAERLQSLGSLVAGAAKREASRVREGFVYIIVNDSLPGVLKIGSAVDATSRLGDAQTWDPLRRFRVAHSVYVPDRNASERRIHERLREYRLHGEWFAVSLSQARSALEAER